MKLLEDLARKHPVFVTQLVAVMKNKKPAVRVDFDFFGEDYNRFIDLLTNLQVVWFYHSPCPINICYPTVLHKSIKSEVKLYDVFISNKESYPYLHLSSEIDDYDKFWDSLAKGKFLPFMFSGGAQSSYDETIIAKDFAGLKNFLIQYAIAIKKKKKFQKILGRAFGYPNCCIKKFDKEDQKGDYIFFESIIKKDLGNVVPIELRVVGHVPCDVLCKPSISLGREYLDTLRIFDYNLYRIVIEEIGKPTLALKDRWHHFRINEVEYASVKDSVKIKEKEFLNKVKEMDIEAKEILLGSIESCPHVYLPDFIRLWWIAVDPGNIILLCDTNTGETKKFKKDQHTNMADLRVYRYKK